MKPDDLIELARELARRDIGRPKSVSLRRSASSAYYALFHTLSYLCADQLVGWRQPYSVFTPIYRALEHARARSVLNASRQKTSRDEMIEAVAVTFAALQDARHDADYNPEPFSFSRSGTLDLIDSAEQAIVAIRSSRSGETEHAAFRTARYPLSRSLRLPSSSSSSHADRARLQL